MGKSVIVFVVEESDVPVPLPIFVAQAKENFKDIPNVKIYAARNRIAERVIKIFAPLQKEEKRDSN